MAEGREIVISLFTPHFQSVFVRVVFVFFILCIQSRSIIVVVGPLFISTTRIPRINVKEVLRYFYVYQAGERDHLGC